MKKIYTLFMVTAIALTAKAQLVFNENFTGYTNGNLGTQGSWVQSDNGTDVQVASATPMIYSVYTSGNQYITVASRNGLDPHKLFSTNISTSSDRTIFMSFLVRVTHAQKSDNSPNYSIALFNTGSNERPLRFFVAEEPSNSNQIRFGIATGNANNVAYTSNTASFAYNTIYLIVIRYDVFSAAGDNDDAYLWVNPSLATEPSTSTATGGTGATRSNAAEANFGSVLDALEISQSSNSDSPDGNYDAFKVAHGATSAAAWANLIPVGATLPVRLTSFNASRDNLNNIKLVWNTVEESGIASYVVEKSTDGRTFNAIGTVAASKQKTYSFTDVQSSSDFSYYRLKIMEDDGSFKYSYIVSLKSKLVLNISLSPNPVKDRLMIQHPKVITDGHIQIVNANGQFIKDVRLPANAVISTIDMSGLANGMYHVIFRNGPDKLTKTVLKQ